MSVLEIVITVITAYYGGRTRQWWISRSDRKTAGAINHLTEKFKPKVDK